jgi:hypothetical protein
MIITNLTYNTSGLGNQMFRLSFLIGLSKLKNCKIILPNSKSDLDYFGIDDLKGNIEFDYLNIQENKFSFDENLFNINNNTNYKGFFQSEKYFKHAEKEIRNIFKFDEKLYKKFDYLKNKFVGIHIRRGDYLSDINNNKHNVLNLEYVLESIKKYNGYKFYVISDDIKWCKENLTFENFTFSDNTDIYSDLCAYSLCEHQIIYNSTFSWWGAWLNDNKNKKITYPNVWFGKELSHLDTKDIIPNEWK